MTTTVAANPVSTSMVLAIIDEAKAKQYPSGVIGVRGIPDRAASADLEHGGQHVRVRPAESALAVREVLAERGATDWLVVVTDRREDDLGAGILAHFIWQRLRSPDPWEAVRHRFAATGIDPALTAVTDSRELATGLLAATPATGWPAAPVGVLTRNHALAAVATTHLDLYSDTSDAAAVLRWTLRPQSVEAVATLRHDVGDRLADEVVDWIASRCGVAADPVRALLRRGEMPDLVPLGIVLSLVTSGELRGADLEHQAQLALARLEPRWGQPRPSQASLRALGAATAGMLDDLVHDRRWERDVDRALARADTIIGDIQAEGLTVYSDLLPRGFRARLVLLSGLLTRAAAADSTSPVWDELEAAWARVTSHRQGGGDGPLLLPFHAAVRLARWLGSVPGSDGDLAQLSRSFMDHGAWVEAAVNDAYAGADNPELAAALRAILEAVGRRRTSEERAFAVALANDVETATGGPERDGVTADGETVWYLERLLPVAVLPMARKTPVLFLVMDGMSAATATELLYDATERRGWVEAGLPGSTRGRRAAGLAVLPSLTEASRASMLCGRLIRGQQAVENKGYMELVRGAGKIRGVLLHKKAVDTLQAGWAVSDEVGRAIDDSEVGLVTVVLNTIDDALDRSDPAGTTWNAEAVKHLVPLLARARVAGRTVVMTADHGHVVERRHGTQRSHPGMESARSRVPGGPVQEDEVEVHGARVLTPDHRAVLAVDEALRYGPLKAGYHGGASAAEVVIPVAVLVPGEDRNPLNLPLLPPQMPTWWFTREGAEEAPRPTAKRSTPVLPPPVADAGLTLFDVEEPPAPEEPADAASLGGEVIASDVYRVQRKVAGRVLVSDDQVASFVNALAAARDGRLPMPLAARGLGVSEVRLRGALAQVQQLLNVEGYAVLQTDPLTKSVTLDEPLLREQFQVR